MVLFCKKENILNYISLDFFSVIITENTNLLNSHLQFFEHIIVPCVRHFFQMLLQLLHFTFHF